MDFLNESIMSSKYDIMLSKYSLNEVTESCVTEFCVSSEFAVSKIEEYGYKGYMAILQSKLDEALFDLNKFKTISSEIPDWGGKVNCVLDYIMHGQRWLCNEIRSRTIIRG